MFRSRLAPGFLDCGPVLGLGAESRALGQKLRLAEQKNPQGDYPRALVAYSRMSFPYDVLY